jgi:uroporphyrinogen-III synthase
MQRPSVVVTRPESQAGAWVQALRAAGWPVVALPLIATCPTVAPDAPAPWTGGERWDAVMVVSPAAVQAAQHARWPVPAPPTRLWAPGAGTAAALRAWGADPARVDAPSADAGPATMDSESLWSLVRPQMGPGRRLLVLRGVSADGREGRDWLLQRARASGADVVALPVYRRALPAWGEAQRRHATDLGRAVWLFSASEAVAHLQQLLPHAVWRDATAVVTHPRIAQAAAAAGFGRVVVAAPTVAAVLQALESVA